MQRATVSWPLTWPRMCDDGVLRTADEFVRWRNFPLERWGPEWPHLCRDGISRSKADFLVWLFMKQPGDDDPATWRKVGLPFHLSADGTSLFMDHPQWDMDTVLEAVDKLTLEQASRIRFIYDGQQRYDTTATKRWYRENGLPNLE